MVGAAAAPELGDEELYGAVGGVPTDFLRDEPIVVNPRRRRVEPDNDVNFVDDYYG